MDGTKEVAWAVDFREGGQRSVTINFAKHETPQQAMEAFAELKRKPWPELEMMGAKIVKREMTILPPPKPRDLLKP